MMAFLQMIGEVIFLSRFEIGVFFLAAGIHFLLFGKHRFDFTVSSKSLKQGHALNEFSKGHAAESTTPAQLQPVAALLRALKPLLRCGSTQKVFENLPGSARLAELLLRNYMGLRLRTNFEQLLSEVEDASSASGSKLSFGIAALALQSALGAKDLEGSLRWLPKLAGQEQQPTQNAEQESVPVVLNELVKCNFLVAETLEPIFVEAAQRGDLETAKKVELLAKDQGVVLTPSARCALLVGLSASGGSQHERVLEYYQSILSEVDVLTVHTKAGGIVAEAALRLNRDDVLKLLLRDCEDARRVGLLKSFGVAGRIEDVRRLFKACAEKSACIHNALLDATVSSGGSASAIGKVMDEATNSGVADVVTYNTMIKGHLQSGDFKGALKVLAAMRTSGLKPNHVTFNELIDASLATSPDTAWAFMDEMKACGLKPNKVTCSILLKSLHSHTRTPIVERVMAQLSHNEEGMDEVLLSSVCEACIRTNRGDLLGPHLRRQKSGKAVQVQGAHTFGSLIRAHGFVNDLEGVWSCWRDMNKRHILPTSITLGCTVEALVKNDDIEAGYELIREVSTNPQTKPLVNAVIYGSVLKGFCHQKRFDRVWVVYDEMLAEKMQFSIVTFNSLIDACARSGDMHRVQPLLEDMSRQGITPNVITYSTVLKGYCSANRLDEAFQLFEEMKTNTTLSPDEVTYNTLLDGCARHGLFDRGMAVLDEMRRVKVPPSNFTLSVLVKLATRAKLTHKAFELVEEISKEFRLRPNVHVYNNLIQACTVASGDQKQRGLQVLQTMLEDKVSPDHRSYALLLRAAVASGNAQDAAQLVRSAAGLRGGHPRTAASGLAQLRGGASALQRDLLTEVLEFLCGPRGDSEMAHQLVWELSRLPGVQLDPKLRHRVASETLRR
eukprot:CAMPEP_0115151574 /NCGR_PEP_ID=MMETSP0227-20121206/65673_1 /TAXON_ID=89957 /ORGANISM="Polarella glacialis, Strain CCMP 1383" /LENGTH=895 /DNA_ID=CAMNT_0002562071 /DNA_START=158 /DNA_END=2845 /DNA_ORIENTATION=-